MATKEQMNSIKNLPGMEGDKQMNTNRKIAIKESKMKVTTPKLIRWAGLAAMASGLLFIVIQPIHPPDALLSVTTPQWLMVHYLSIAMDIFALLGVLGLYARQVEKSGWLGLAGYLLFSFFWALSLAFHFIEVFITPIVAVNAPKIAEGLLGIVNGTPSQISLSALPAVNMLAGIIGYALGGLLFGIAMLRAGVLPRWAGGLLAFGIVLPFFTQSFVQHPYDRLFAVPVGLALAWLGYALVTERRVPAPQPLSEEPRSRLNQSAAD